eukprot:UN27840
MDVQTQNSAANNNKFVTNNNSFPNNNNNTTLNNSNQVKQYPTMNPSQGGYQSQSVGYMSNTQVQYGYSAQQPIQQYGVHRVPPPQQLIAPQTVRIYGANSGFYNSIHNTQPHTGMTSVYPAINTRTLPILPPPPLSNSMNNNNLTASKTAFQMKLKNKFASMTNPIKPSHHFRTVHHSTPSNQR